MWVDGNGRRRSACKKTVRGAALFSHAARRDRNLHGLEVPEPLQRFGERTSEEPRREPRQRSGPTTRAEQHVEQCERVEVIPAMPSHKDLGMMGALASLMALGESHTSSLARTWRSLKEVPRRIFPRRRGDR